MFRCIYIFVKVIFDLRSQFVCLTTFIVHSVLFYDFIFRTINDKSYWYGTRYDKVEKELYQFPLNSFHTRVIFKNICWLSFGIIILLSFLLGSNKKKKHGLFNKSYIMTYVSKNAHILFPFIIYSKCVYGGYRSAKSDFSMQHYISFWFWGNKSN